MFLVTTGEKPVMSWPKEKKKGGDMVIPPKISGKP